MDDQNPLLDAVHRPLQESPTRPQDCTRHQLNPTRTTAERPNPPDIRPATIHDLHAILRLQRQASNQVGFLTQRALISHLHAKDVRVAEHYGEVTGYLLGRHSLAWAPLLATITQLAVDKFHRGTSIASALLAHWKQECENQSCVGIQANCLANLPANDFWQRKGFIKICAMTPDNARKQDVICWRLPLTRKLPMWFADPPKRAGHHARKPTVNQRQRHRTAPARTCM